MNGFKKEKIFFSGDKPPIDGKKIGKIAVIVIAVLIVILIAATCWYTVDEKEQAVITTFGKVTDVVDNAGMHFKLPLGIQQAHKVAVNVYQKIELGYRSDGSEAKNLEAVQKESKMITGDFNIVNVDFFIEYKISDPAKYLYNSKNPEDVLKNLIQSQVRAVVGSYTVDDVLTDGKAKIQSRVKQLVTDALKEYDIGLILTDVKIQDAEPPTEQVIEAFKAVESAKQGRETAINEAEAYKVTKIKEAEAEVNRLTENAEYLKTKRINEAKEIKKMFDARYGQYVQSRSMTRKRMYYEMLTEALPGVKVYLDVSDGATDKLVLVEDAVRAN